MDMLLAQSLVGVGSSLVTQVVKGENASWVENTLMAGGVAVGGSALANYALGWDAGYTYPIVMAYATHGVFHQIELMNRLKLGLRDKLFHGVSNMIHVK